MTITWLGHSSFKIQNKETTLVTDPFDKSIGINFPKTEAQIVTISHDHYDHSSLKKITGNPLVVDRPGEYEKGGITVKGILSFHDNKNGKERGLNTIYLIEVEDIRICHLGDLGQSKLSEEQLDKLDGVDILLIPVGGIYTIDAKDAANLVNEIEPRIVIPMHYKIPGLNIKLNTVDKFCKEMGASGKEKINKLKIKKKDLPQEETKVYVMLPAK